MITQPTVLMYHGIIAADAVIPVERETGAELYDVTTENFRAQLTYLKTHDYRTITIHKNLDVFSSQEILLTFDDGEMNNCTMAFPLLMEFGFVGHFFLIAKRIGREGYMGWEEIRQMTSAGMIIGSHGFSHEILTNLQDTQIQEELIASKRYLERNLGILVESLSIPRGFCNDKIIQMARGAGYRYVFISEKSVDIHENCFSRAAVKSSWSLERFAQALEGKTPLPERIFVSCKDGVKKVLGGAFYDRLRRVMLKIKS